MVTDKGKPSEMVILEGEILKGADENAKGQ